MLAAVLTEPRCFEIRELTQPEPAANEVRVQLEGCGICASNLPPWEGQSWFTYPFEPGAPGHEGWGRVHAVGRDVTEFRIGDRVGALSTHAFAEFDCVPADAVIPLPSEFDGEPFPAEPLGCALNVFRRSGIGPGQRVAVVGCGFLGLIVARMAVASGASVMAISRREDGLEFARRFGVSECVKITGQALDEVLERTRGRLFDVVIEATGKQEPLDLAAELTGVHGRLVIAGYHQDGPRQVDLQLWNWRGIDVINAHERDPAVNASGMRAAARAIADGLFDPTPLYTHHFAIADLNEAMATAVERPPGFLKGLVMMPGGER